MTLINWLAKGASFTSSLIESLKDRAMVEDSIINCDETWCKVKVNGHFMKKYIWCFIRLLAGERKNSLFFTGSRMANVLAAYHTLLSTCCMNGLFALEYLKNFFREVVNGRRDYENLLPMTIGLSINKY